MPNVCTVSSLQLLRLVRLTCRKFQEESDKSAETQITSLQLQLITVILEEEAQGFTNILSLRKSEKNFGFSDGYVPIYCDDIDFLKDRRVTHIAFSPHFPNIVVACYDASATSEADYLPAEITKRWLVCLWDIIVVSQPLKILVASAPIRSIIFDCLYSDLVYAGLSNG